MSVLIKRSATSFLTSSLLRTRHLAHGTSRYNTDAVVSARAVEHALSAIRTRRQSIEKELMAGETSLGERDEVDEYVHYNLRSLIMKFKRTSGHHDDHYNKHTTAFLKPIHTSSSTSSTITPPPQRPPPPPCHYGATATSNNIYASTIATEDVVGSKDAAVPVQVTATTSRVISLRDTKSASWRPRQRAVVDPADGASTLNRNMAFLSMTTGATFVEGDDHFGVSLN